MAEDESGQEKKHDASERKKDEAADKGNIAKSPDVNSVVVLTTGGLVLVYGMAMMGQPVLHFGTELWGLDGRQSMDVAHVRGLAEAAAWSMGGAIALPLGAALIAGVGASLAQSGGKLATKALEPRPEALNPLTGFKSKYMSSMPVVELVKGMGKLFVMAAAVAWMLWDRIWDIPSMATLAPAALMAEIGDLCMTVLVAVLPVVTLLAAIDYLYQRWKIAEDLKMTDQEMKDSHKQQEGDPHYKAQRRQRQRQIAMGTMILAMADADVLVTNPTHYAVALRYKRGEDAAPVVLAKGVDHVALKLRAEARRLGVPQIENRPLARALHAKVQVGRAIPEELFAPVAKVLAVVFRRRARARLNRLGRGA